MFWTLDESDARPADFDQSTGSERTYGDLAHDVAALSGRIAGDRKRLVALFCDNSAASLTVYLAGLTANHAVLLAPAQMSAELAQRLVQAYRPDVLGYVGDDIPQWIDSEPYSAIAHDVPRLMLRQRRALAEGPQIHSDLAVLLPTSGTTGSPKFVRLSRANLQSNADAIAAALSLTPDDAPITTLPMSYSYGLSVINSHMAAGARMVLSNASVVSRDFWTLCTERSCTSMAGVPFTYSVLRRLGFAERSLPALRTMTQAGGRLGVDLTGYFAEACRAKGVKFFVMYGQTEATARISCLPPDALPQKIGSIGRPIPGGQLEIDTCGGSGGGAPAAGELIYRGPNVMMGYALERGDLGRGDEMGGVLRTGDLGYRDDDGFFYVTGRVKRFIKVHGLRINLDEVESQVEEQTKCRVACVGQDDRLVLFLAGASQLEATTVKERILVLYQLHHSTVEVRPTPEIPVNGSGKPDYQSLQESLGGAIAG